MTKVSAICIIKEDNDDLRDKMVEYGLNVISDGNQIVYFQDDLEYQYKYQLEKYPHDTGNIQYMYDTIKSKTTLTI